MSLGCFCNSNGIEDVDFRKTSCDSSGKCQCKPKRFQGAKCFECGPGYSGSPHCNYCAPDYYGYPDCKSKLLYHKIDI